VTGHPISELEAAEFGYTSQHVHVALGGRQTPDLLVTGATFHCTIEAHPFFLGIDVSKTAMMLIDIYAGMRPPKGLERSLPAE
jgi:hypothetical protein